MPVFAYEKASGERTADDVRRRLPCLGDELDAKWMWTVEVYISDSLMYFEVTSPRSTALMRQTTQQHHRSGPSSNFNPFNVKVFQIRLQLFQSARVDRSLACPRLYLTRRCVLDATISTSYWFRTFVIASSWTAIPAPRLRTNIMIRIVSIFCYCDILLIVLLESH